MTPYHIRNFEPEDAPRMETLQAACIETSGDMPVLPAGFYWAPGFENGQNIFVALDQAGQHAGHVAIYPHQVSPALGGAQILWMDIRVDARLQDAGTLREQLLERAVERACQIKNNLGQSKTALSATYFARGTESIAYLSSRGFSPYETGFTLRRGLKDALPVSPTPEGIEIRAWRMETPTEQESYLHAYQAVFQESSAWTLDSLRHFMKSELWAAGTTFSAFDRDGLVGSVMAYYNPDSPEKIGSTEHVFVLSRWRGKGVAQAMLCQALNFLKEHNQVAAELQVSGKNRQAIAIYEKLGYELFQEEISLGRFV